MIWQMFQQLKFSFNVSQKNRRRTFWHYPRHSTITQSRTISSQWLKYANFAYAGASAYETVGNRRVNKCLYEPYTQVTIVIIHFFQPGLGHSFHQNSCRFLSPPRPSFCGRKISFFRFFALSGSSGHRLCRSRGSIHLRKAPKSQFPNPRENSCLNLKKKVKFPVQK